jgi:hypothetical protein
MMNVFRIIFIMKDIVTIKISRSIAVLTWVNYSCLFESRAERGSQTNNPVLSD